MIDLARCLADPAYHMRVVLELENERLRPVSLYERPVAESRGFLTDERHAQIESKEVLPCEA